MLKALPVLLVLGITAGYVLIRSDLLRELVIRAAVQKLDQATGGRTQIGTLELQAWPLRARFCNIIVHNRQHLDQPPILTIDALEVQSHFWALLSRSIRFEELVIDHPILRTFVDDRGTATIFPLSALRQGSVGNIAAVSIDHFILRNGELAYLRQQTPVAANVYGLEISVDFENHATRYRASIAYSDARLEYAHYAPLRHSLSATLSGTASRCLIESVSAAIGSSTVVFSGELNDFSNPRFDGSYKAHIHGEDFRSNLLPFGIAGDVQLGGRVHYQNTATRPWLMNLTVAGHMASETVTLVSHSRALQFRAFHGFYQLGNGALQARDIGAELLGAQGSAEITIEHLESTPKYRFKGSIVGADVRALQLAISDPRLESVAFSGILDGTVGASWTGSVSNTTLDCDFRVHPAADPRADASGIQVPVQGVIRFSYNRLRDVITFKETLFYVANSEIALQGEASDHSNLQIHASAPDLSPLSSLVSHFFRHDRGAVSVSGSALLDATIHESLHAPHIFGHFTAQNLFVQSTRWRSATVNFEVRQSQITVQSAMLVGVNHGRLSLHGSLGLSNWLYLRSNPLNASVLVTRMPVADLQGFVDIHYPISGEISADLSIHGSAVDPLGSGTIRMTNGHIYDEPVPNAILEWRAKNGSITTDITVATAAGSASGMLSYTPKTGIYKLGANAPVIALQEVSALRARGVPLTGVMKASVSGEGELASPEFAAVFEIAHAQFRDTSITQLIAKVQIANKRADFNINSQVANAAVHLQGFSNLTGNYYSQAVLDTGTIQLNDLLGLRSANPGEGLQGQTELHATMKGSLKNVAELEAHVTVPLLAAKYKSLEITSAAPLRIDYEDSVAKLLPAEIVGAGTSLRVEGSLPLGGMSSLSVTAHGTLDARLLGMINTELKTAGVVSFDLRTTGSMHNPSVLGQLHLQDVALSTVAAPVGIENLSGSLEVANNRVRVSTLSGQLGGGQLAITGSVDYWPNPHFQIGLETKGSRLWYAGGVLLVLDSQLALTGKPHASTLNGRVLIEKVSFTPDFDLKTLSEHLGGTTSPHSAGFSDSVKLAVAVQSQGRLSATSSQASVEGTVNLNLIGTAAKPVVVGRTDLSSGELFYARRRYQLQRAIAVFNDPNETRPVLDVSATTTVQQYHLTMGLRGPLDKLTTSYAADPPLATADIINLLVAGRTTQTVDVAGTDSVIASQVAGHFSSKMQTLTGISGLRIDPLVGGSNRNPSARIAIEQRVTKNFLFSFSTDVSQPNGETVAGEYQINRKWSIGASRDPVGGVAVMGRHHTTF